MAFYPQSRQQRHSIGIRRNFEQTTAECGICQKPTSTRRPYSVFGATSHLPICDDCTVKHGGPDMLRRVQQSEQIDHPKLSSSDYSQQYRAAMKERKYAEAAETKSNARKHGIQLQAVAQYRF